MLELLNIIEKFEPNTEPLSVYKNLFWKLQKLTFSKVQQIENDSFEFFFNQSFAGC